MAIAGTNNKNKAKFLTNMERARQTYRPIDSRQNDDNQTERQSTKRQFIIQEDNI